MKIAKTLNSHHVNGKVLDWLIRRQQKTIYAISLLRDRPLPVHTVPSCKPQKAKKNSTQEKPGKRRRAILSVQNAYHGETKWSC